MKNDKGELAYQVLITSIDVVYNDCNEIGINETCTPKITIQPENATNKKLQFIMAETHYNKCNNYTLSSSEYLIINSATGTLKKIKEYSEDLKSTFVDITVKTTDGSNLTVTDTVRVFSGKTCDDEL